MHTETARRLFLGNNAVSLLSAERRRSDHGITPTMSVLIATKNRPHDLAEAVRSVLEQTQLPSELIILDQSDVDFGQYLVEQEFAAASEDVRKTVNLHHIIDSSVPGLAPARNRLLDVAAGGIVLFIDDDAYLEPDFIKQILACYADREDLVGVSGIITNYTRPEWTSRLWPSIFARGPFHDERQPIYWSAERLRGTDPIRVRKFTGASMSFRADAIRDLRFDANLTGVSLAEDIDFCAALRGRPLVIAPRARLAHNKSPINRDRDHWLREHAQAAHYLYRKHWKSGLRNRLCFLWLHVGYLSAMPRACLRRMSSEPWRAFRTGARRGAELTSGRKNFTV
jgi:GT2 family glycosyltransferase